MTSYPDSVRYLYSLGNEIRTIKLGLERVSLLFSALGHPERSFRTVHIAGTNGKGSVAAMIESGLRRSGARTGLYTSPHLIEPTERIQVDGVPVSEERFSAAFDQVHRTAERLHGEGRLEAHPTYFETVTAMGFLLFRDLGVETAVVETGLGGRLDSTNVLAPALSVITRIDYDHETHLGNSIESIAGEKAGILKPGVPAVFAPQRDEALKVLEARARALGVPVVAAGHWQVDRLALDAGGSRFRTRRDALELAIECPLAGAHQVENSLTALSAMLERGLAPKTAADGIRQVRWPGRLERVRQAPDIILDGAHNPGGIRALAAYIREFCSQRRVWIIYGAMRDKSLDEIAGILSPLADHMVLARPDMHRALRAESLRALFDHSSVHVAESVEAALAFAGQAEPEDVVFVTGSLILVGEARKLLLA